MGLGDFGLYIHVPFCRHFCSYCDFPKTLATSEAAASEYFDAILRQTGHWIDHPVWGPDLKSNKISSLNFGGGTPGLFTIQYQPLLRYLKPFLREDAEISLEVNPNDISEVTLNSWQTLGFNRLSIGVQTFDADGLSLLKRDHSSEIATQNVRLAKQYFQNCNCDLIFSWPGQTLDSWKSDLDQLISLDVPHVSLYNLCCEEPTPLTRAIQSGTYAKKPDDVQWSLHEIARQKLARAGFLHEEVSNWRKPGFSCKHNWLYWTGGHYIGLGTGAHGFLPGNSSLGVRYAFPNSTKKVLSLNPPRFFDYSSLVQDLREAGLSVETERTSEDWLMEYVGCGLRASRGISLQRIEDTTGRIFRPRPNVEIGLKKGLLTISPDKQLILSSDEWFRETAWSLEVVLSF